jgi:hypothetical protein
MLQCGIVFSSNKPIQEFESLSTYSGIWRLDAAENHYME